MSKTRRSSKSSGPAPASGTSGRRKVAVFLSLVVVLTFTSALLLALAPDPLTPHASGSLFATTNESQSLDMLFDQNAVKVEAGHWHGIFIHHSRGLSGSAQSLGDANGTLCDHFVIGNGDGCADGEIQRGWRWDHQLPPGKITGLTSIRPDCISICLVGDFNQGRPTPTQQRRLEQLVSFLQERLHIHQDRISVHPETGTEAGVGAYFPTRQFFQQILP